MVSLAEQMRGISPKDVTFTTVPVGNASYTAPTGQSAVLWDVPASQKLFAELKSNGKASARPHGRAKRPRRCGAARCRWTCTTGPSSAGWPPAPEPQLTTLGFRVHQANLDSTSQDITQTMIQYPAGGKAAAQLVQRVLPGSVLQQVNGVARVRIVLGQTGHAISAQPAGHAQPGVLRRSRRRRPRTPAGTSPGG